MGGAQGGGDRERCEVEGGPLCCPQDTVCLCPVPGFQVLAVTLDLCPAPVTSPPHVTRQPPRPRPSSEGGGGEQGRREEATKT